MKKIIRPALFCALVIQSPFIFAADVSALEAKVAQLESEVQALKTESGTVLSHSSAQVSLSGQVNRAMVYIDDGRNTEFSGVDNDASSTRFALNAEANFDNDWLMGATWETEFESDSSRAINQFDLSSSGSLNDRKLEIYFDHAAWGRVSLGQGRTASDQTSENTLAGTQLISYASSAERMAGGFFMRDNRLSNADFRDDVLDGSAPQITEIFGSQDGLGLGDRLRYDSPKWQGFSLATSVQQRGVWDAAINYQCDCEQMQMQASLAYTDNGERNEKYGVNGSFAILHKDSGLNMAFSVAENKRSNKAGAGFDNNRKFLYSQFGKKMRLISWGATNFAIDYTRVEDSLENGDKGQSFGLGVQQEVDKLNADIYAGLRRYTYDVTDNSASFSNFKVAMIGARLWF